MNTTTLESFDGNLILLLCVICLIAYIIIKSPFNYPYFIHSFDISGKRNPQTEDLIDNFLISGNFAIIQQHYKKIEAWKTTCEKKASESILKSLREKQFYACIDDNNAFKFNLTREQTRYKQQYYIKTSYKVTNKVGSFECSYSYLLQRELLLRDLNYECSLRDYNCKKQRSLMTKELRRKIIARDNYTCQYCSKYMPDEVGLHIDHIVSISKGGKTVPSNLQVLCSKCNGSKSNKY